MTADHGDSPTSTMTLLRKAVLEAFVTRGRSWIFLTDLPCSRSVVQRMKKIGWLTTQAHHRETGVHITEAGRIAYAEVIGVTYDPFPAARRNDVSNG